MRIIVLLFMMVIGGCDSIIEDTNMADTPHLRHVKLQTKQLKRIADDLERMEKK